MTNEQFAAFLLELHAGMLDTIGELAKRSPKSYRRGAFRELVWQADRLAMQINLLIENNGEHGVRVMFVADAMRVSKEIEEAGRHDNSGL